MEKRLCKVNISVAGGTASAGSKTYKITLPSAWLLELGVTPENRRMELTYDGNQIIITPHLPMKEFIAQRKALGHKLHLFRYYDSDHLCTTICADLTTQELSIENHTLTLSKTAFGKNELPSWDDFLSFLEERCIPRGRAGLREYLEALGISEYDPFEIIQKTNGRMAEDQQWLKIEVL